MAVSAKFIADFSSFNAAVDKAETKLSEFRTESARVESQLKRMGDSFSGKKILSDATLAAKAVEDLGGVSKLTADEQKRLNSIMTEALAKYKALGQEAPKHLQSMAAATTPATKGFTSMLGVIKQIGPALGLSLSVGSVIAFSKAIGDFAGKMLDLNAETQIATKRLQAFDIVGGDVSLTVDDIVTSADQLAKRLGGDDKSVNEALAKLNLRSADLKKLSLDQVMFAIDKSLMGVGNQFDRARILSDLFGRSGAQLGRIMDGSLQQVIESVEKTRAVIDEDLLKKADAVADAWGRAWKRFRAEALVAIGAVTEAISNTVFLGNFRKQEGLAPIAPIASHAAAPKMLASHGEDLKKVEKVYREIAALTTPLLEVKASMLSLATAAPMLIRSLDEGVPILASWNTIVEKQPLDLKKWENALYALPPAIESIGVELEQTHKKAGLFSGLKGGLAGLLTGITGGGGFAGALGKVGTGISEGFGNLISGGLTNLISGGINLLGKGISSLFGKLTGKEGKQVNDLRDAAIAAAGGFEALNTKAALAGTSLERLLSTKKVNDYNEAWKDLQGTLDEYAQDQADLQAAIEEYGFTIEQLGPALQKQELDEQAKKLTNQWRLLVGAGIEIATVNEKMAATVDEYLQTALRVGAEVPAAMRPILQSMIDQGTLVDENGEAITDLEKAGVKFSETMTEGFDRVVRKLDELIQRLQAAGTAIGNIPSSIDIDTNYRGGVLQVPDYQQDNFPAFASGTRGRFLDFKSGTPVMLHGRERVMTEAESRTDTGALDDIASALDGIDRRISTAVSRAVTDALILAPGWR